MKRKDFINQLAKIAERNSQVLNIKQIPLFCCKQFKINQRTSTESHQQYQANPQKQSGSKLNKQTVLIISNNISKRANSAFQNKEETRNTRPSRRILTTPSSLSMASRQEKEKKIQQDLSLQSPQQSNKDHSTLQPQQLSHMKRNSYTEPCQSYKHPTNSKSYTSRALYVSSICSKKKENQKSSRIRPGSAFKHKSTQQQQSPQKRVGERRITISLRKQLINSYNRPFQPPPKLTAKSYIIYEIKPNPQESNLIFSFNSKNSQEVASLTKIMTCLVTIQLCQQFDVDKHSQEVEIGRMEASLGGTSANLEKGQIYTIAQLLYGLMLPSGNDASVALAVWGGRKLLLKEKEQKLDKNITILHNSCLRSTAQSASEFPKKSQCYNRFLKEMNSRARELKMTKTTYSNSHGLINQNNRSTAYDVAVLTSHAMRNPVFREIVQTKEYKGLIRANPDSSLSRESTPSDEEQDSSQNFYNPQVERNPKSTSSELSVNKQSEKKMTVQWKNTHKLLHLKPKEYIGVKTGFTTMAGPCLCSCLSTSNRQFVIVVLSCRKMSLRFKETQILRKWLYKRESLGKRKKGEQKEEEGSEADVDIDVPNTQQGD